MSYQKVQNFKCRCPLIQTGVYGLSESHQIPNIPCDRSLNDVFLNQHLQWYHNFDSVSSRKLVRAICNDVPLTHHLFSSHETVIKQNITVENYKCKCPLTQDGVFGLSDEHDITNIPCGRAEKEVLCFQHLQYHHNLSSRAAKKIVCALLSYTPKITQLFDHDDLITQSKCAVRKMKSRCPLLARHVYGLNDHHHVPNIPCDRADQEIFLFPHLTYFHKLNAKAATKLIRALLIQKSPFEPIFHPNETIIVTHSNLTQKRTKTTTEKRKKSETYEQTIIDLSSHVNPRSSLLVQYQNLLNVLQSSINEQNSSEKNDPNSMPLDFTRVKRSSTYQQVSSNYSNSDVTDGDHVNIRLCTKNH